MVNYGAAFKLPFTSLNRSAALFLVAAVASLANVSYSMISKMLKNEAGQYRGQALGLDLSAALISIGVTLLFSAVISGYSIRLTANAMRGKHEMPPFDNVPSLIGAGFKYLAAILVYTLPLLLFIILIGIAAASKSLILLLFTVIIGMIVILLWAFFMLYCMPMLQAQFARENRFVAFFELRKILKYSFTSAYFVPWIVSIGYSIGVGIPYIIIARLIGLLAEMYLLAMLFLVPFAALYGFILTPTLASLYGQAYKDVIGRKAKAAAATPDAIAKPKAVKGKSKK